MPIQPIPISTPASTRRITTNVAGTILGLVHLHLHNNALHRKIHRRLLQSIFLRRPRTPPNRTRILLSQRRDALEQGTNAVWRLFRIAGRVFGMV
jgi:hypothetical protein